MSIQNEYLNGLMERVIQRDPAEPEFHQAVREVLTSLAPVANARPELISEGVMDCLVEPERDHQVPGPLGGRPGEGPCQPGLPRPVQQRHRPL